MICTVKKKRFCSFLLYYYCYSAPLVFLRIPVYYIIYTYIIKYKTEIMMMMRYIYITLTTARSTLWAEAFTHYTNKFFSLLTTPNYPQHLVQINSYFTTWWLLLCGRLYVNWRGGVNILKGTFAWNGFDLAIIFYFNS